MVLSTSGTNKVTERPKITPFQHWFNKNQNRLKEEYMDEFINLDMGHKEGFINWCQEKYNDKK